VNQAKYIGMDVHQATISVAVMDSAGKLILESILETKAATILQFIGGLRGSLLVTFEEGTSAAWLYDLLKPHVANVLVCDPRKNALLKDGSKSDRIDARKLAELLRGNYLSPIYHGENGVRTLKELARSYLNDHQRSDKGDESDQGGVPKLGHSLRWASCVSTASSCGMVGQDCRTGSSPASRAALPATGCVGAFAARSATRSAGGEPETSGGEITASDSLSGSDSLRVVGGTARDAASFSHQATAVGLQRIRTGDSRQRRIPLCERAPATQPRASHRAGTERKPQSRSKKSLQECRNICQHSAGAVPGVLRGASGQREEAGDGASHSGTEDCSDHVDHLEERSVFRRQRITSASSLSVSGRELVPSSWVVVGSVLETLGSRGVSDRWSDPVCFGTESPFSRYAPSENQK